MSRQDKFETQEFTTKRKRNRNQDYGDGFDSSEPVSKPAAQKKPKDDEVDLYSYSKEFEKKTKGSKNKTPAIIIGITAAIVIIIAVVTILIVNGAFSGKPADTTESTSAGTETTETTRPKTTSATSQNAVNNETQAPATQATNAPETEKPTQAPTQAPKPTAAPTQAPKPTAAPTQAPKPTQAPTQAPDDDDDYSNMATD